MCSLRRVPVIPASPPHFAPTGGIETLELGVSLCRRAESCSSRGLEAVADKCIDQYLTLPPQTIETEQHPEADAVGM